MARTSHSAPLVDGRLLSVVIALALIMVVAQPVASLAWLEGAHATIEQAALHEAALEQTHHHHHGASQHHDHQPGGGAGKRDAQFAQTALGPTFAFSTFTLGPFHDLLQAMLSVLAEAFSPDASLRYLPSVEVIRPQHSPPVPHRPPVSR